jgi:LacI family transcriptional regulator
VLAVAEKLGYSPSALARALVKRNSRIIGVIVSDIVDPYFAEIARGVEEAANRAGYLTMVCSADRGAAAELEHLRVLRDYHAAGVVFAGSGTAEDPHGGELTDVVRQLQEQDATVVAVAPRELDCVTAVVDNRAAAYDLVDYLVSLGHRRIAFVEGPPELLTSRQRLAGFQQAMRDAGLDAELRFDGGFDFESGGSAALRIMTAAPLPDAVVAANDEVAIGVLTGLRHNRIAVPETVSVAGIDDTRSARFLDLTTVSLPLYELGAAAARAIVAEREDGRQPEDVVLPHRLVPRHTTARRTG